MQKFVQIQGASYDLVLLSSSRCLLSSFSVDNVSARSEPLSGLVASVTKPGGIGENDVLASLSLPFL